MSPLRRLAEWAASATRVLFPPSSRLTLIPPGFDRVDVEDSPESLAIVTQPRKCRPQPGTGQDCGEKSAVPLIRTVSVHQCLNS
jgi:hypothetical protein